MRDDQLTHNPSGANVSLLERRGGYANSAPEQRFSTTDEPVPMWPVYDSAEWDTSVWRDTSAE